MIAFWCLVAGVALGIVIGLVAQAEREPFPAATARSVRRARLAARADLRRVLPSRIWWWQ